MNNEQPEKIPDFILLKQSRKEVGQLKAEIDHLNNQIKQKDKLAHNLVKTNLKLDSIISQHQKGMYKDELVKSLQKKIKILNRRIRDLRNNNKELITKLAQYKFSEFKK